MQFVNFQDMSLTILANRRKLPDKIDLIVGVPRTGLLPATMLATQLNLPLTDVDGLKADRIFGFGDTKESPDLARALSSNRTVLVIDDSVSSGRAFRKIRKSLEHIRGNIVYCAVFALIDDHPDVDVVMKKVSAHCIGPWSMLHTNVVGNFCVDVDGVLCRNPGPSEGGGEGYRKFLREVEQLYSTSGEIGCIVTSRLEGYRKETEGWLEAHGIKFKKLVMAKSEDEHKNGAFYKARVYKESGADLFIESEMVDSEKIFEITGKPVLCVATQILLSEQSDLTLNRKVSYEVSTGVAKLKLKIRRFIGDSLYYFLKQMLGRGKASGRENSKSF